MSKPKLGFIGAGNMATAICRGVMRAELLKAADIIASDPDGSRRSLFNKETGVSVMPDNRSAAEAGVVILAVKPQVMDAVLAEIAPALTEKQLVISIAAGVPATQIESASNRPLRVVRAMPNTPMLVGAGAAAVARGRHATQADIQQAIEIFSSCAKVIEVDEELMHAVTALSGSGPAYIFYIAEIMVRAGREMGIPAEQATLLANRTILGAAKMLCETGEPAAELRRKVTSPGGTTAAAINRMEEHAVADKIVDALLAARQRSIELGKSK